MRATRQPPQPPRAARPGSGKHAWPTGEKARGWSRAGPRAQRSRDAGGGVCGAGAAVASGAHLLLVHLEHSHECLLWNLHVAHPFHAAFAFTLLLEQLALPRDVPAVALGKHVLAHRGDSLTGDDLATDRCLYGYLEELTRDQLAKALRQLAPVRVGAIPVDDHAQRIHALSAHEDVELDERLGAETRDHVVE